MEKRWKTAFFVLLSAFLLFLFALIGSYYYFFPSVKEQPLTIDDSQDPGSSMFTVSTTKQQLNWLINEQLAQYERSRKMNLHVSLTDTIVLTGSFTIFSADIPFEMRFKPLALQNGDIVLVEESFRLGRLLLPEEKVLQFIKNGIDLPDWIQILPDKEKIYVALTEVTLENQFYLKAEKINLQTNEIQFLVYRLPEERRKAGKTPVPS